MGSSSAGAADPPIRIWGHFAQAVQKVLARVWGHFVPWSGSAGQKILWKIRGILPDPRVSTEQLPIFATFTTEDAIYYIFIQF